jgi:hypothetical protein
MMIFIRPSAPPFSLESQIQSFGRRPIGFSLVALLDGRNANLLIRFIIYDDVLSTIFLLPNSIDIPQRRTSTSTSLTYT